MSNEKPFDESMLDQLEGSSGRKSIQRSGHPVQQHRLYTLVVEGLLGNTLQNMMVPSPRGRVLDIISGTGNSRWADEFSSTYQIEVTTLNIGNFNLEQPQDGTSGLSSNEFDFIHMRVISGLGNWGDFFNTAYRILKPGAYVQIIGFEFPPTFRDITSDEKSYLARWTKLISEGADKLGIKLVKATELSDLLECRGFENCAIDEGNWAIGSWAERSNLLGIRENLIKEFWMSTFQELSQKFILNSQTKTPEDNQCFLSSVEKEQFGGDSGIAASIKVFTIQARKSNSRSMSILFNDANVIRAS